MTPLARALLALKFFHVGTRTTGATNMMNLSTGRKFGIEIECYGITQETAESAINASGVVCQIECYGHSAPRNWKIVTDASVSDGFEVVSPILSGNEGLEQVRKVSQALASAGAKVDKRCGLHVHVDANDLSGAEMAFIAKRYGKYESEIDSWMPPSRRASMNSYCQPMTSVIERIQTIPVNATAMQVSNLATRSDNDRYYKLNLRSFVRHGTVEFRQHSGTVESRKMIPWIVFCVNFVETSKHTTVGAIVPSPEQLRKNSIQKKFAKLAAILDNHVGRYSWVSAGDIAAAMEIDVDSVPNYISQFRSIYGAEIGCRRNCGYFREDRRSLVELMPVSGTNTTVSVPPTDDSLFLGLDAEIVNYFQERASDLA